MNELQIFKNEEFGEIRTMDIKMKDFMGTFYILEYGSFLKIGSSKRPYKRLKQLERQATKYADLVVGKFAISVPHTNYKDNEKQLHKLFANCRKQGTELFEINFADALAIIEREDIVYEDRTAEMNRKADAFTNGMKSFLLGGTKWNC